MSVECVVRGVLPSAVRKSVCCNTPWTSERRDTHLLPDGDLVGFLGILRGDVDERSRLVLDGVVGQVLDVCA